MNERIKQFSELSKSYKTILVDGQMQSVLLIDPDRFAEMIVKECLSFCDYQGDRFDEYDSGMTERARIIRESIQEHFGVKV
jgi:hypothetical protein